MFSFCWRTWIWRIFTITITESGLFLLQTSSSFLRAVLRTKPLMLPYPEQGCKGRQNPLDLGRSERSWSSSLNVVLSLGFSAWRDFLLWDSAPSKPPAMKPSLSPHQCTGITWSISSTWISDFPSSETYSGKVISGDLALPTRIPSRSLEEYPFNSRVTFRNFGNFNLFVVFVISRCRLHSWIFIHVDLIGLHF